jgi:hypothetical protein
LSLSLSSLSVCLFISREIIVAVLVLCPLSRLRVPCESFLHSGNTCARRDLFSEPAIGLFVTAITFIGPCCRYSGLWISPSESRREKMTTAEVVVLWFCEQPYFAPAILERGYAVSEQGPLEECGKRLMSDLNAQPV